MIVLFAVIGVVLVVVIGFVAVGRETSVLRYQARPAVFDLEEAVGFIADELPEGPAGRLTLDDVRWVLRADVDRLEQATVDADDPDARTDIVDQDGAVARIIELADDQDRDLADEDVVAVLDARSDYLRGHRGHRARGRLSAEKRRRERRKAWLDGRTEERRWSRRERQFLWDLGGGWPLVAVGWATGEYPSVTLGAPAAGTWSRPVTKRRAGNNSYEREGGAPAPPSFVVPVVPAGSRRVGTVAGMDRPLRFEQYRWVGDKRNQVAHDVDHCTNPETIAELMDAGTYICFGPDTLVEARNRCYKACRQCEGARQAQAEEADAADAVAAEA